MRSAQDEHAAIRTFARKPRTGDELAAQEVHERIDGLVVEAHDQEGGF
jgi:hypothetical protein